MGGEMIGNSVERSTEVMVPVGANAECDVTIVVLSSEFPNQTFSGERYGPKRIEGEGKSLDEFHSSVCVIEA
jgi:hypothetical protein